MSVEFERWPYPWQAEYRTVGTGWNTIGVNAINIIILEGIDGEYTIRAANSNGAKLNPILAGPFTTLEAAKAAYMVMYG